VDLNVRDLSKSAGSRTRRLPRAVSNIAALLRRRETQALFYPPTDAAMRVRDLGLVAYWRASGNWGEFCRPLGEDDFVCS
jgi:hypothetical protein